MVTLTDDLITALRAANYVAVLTGAGISAESGIPTFREAQTGLWAQYDPQELATPEAFLKNPKLVWEWYAWRRELVVQAKPNAGHFALVEMARRVRRFTLITQNVDGLHQAAGSEDIVELHGNLRRVKCFREEVIVKNWIDTGEVPPRCPRCGDRLRPDVVWFGERLPIEALTVASAAATTCDLFFSIGTSGLVEPAASLARIAVRHGATLIEINPTSTPLSSLATFVLQAFAGEALPQLVKTVWPEQ